jgi:tetratricopeptide (TPR) repeat protein
LQAQHRFEKALEQFNQEASLAQAAALDDIVAQARYAMAEVQKELGKFDAASESLQKFFELGNTSEQRAQADAYCLKGMLEVQQGKFDESLKSFEVFFEVARAMNDQTLLDAARINLGVVRGHLRHESYMSLVANDMSSLLNWKLTRENLPSLEDVEQQQPPPREQQQQITTCG